METLTTQRLTLRPLRAEDAPAIADAVNETGYMRYMFCWADETEASARRFLDYAVAENAKNPQSNYEYACIDRESGALVACASLMTKGDRAMLGWFVHHSLQGRGYATEAARALMDYAFGKLNMRRVIADCDTRNEKSIAVMERLRLRREGIEAEARPMKPGENHPGDEATYALLKSEWLDDAEQARIHALPLRFDGFMDVPELTDGEIRLVCVAKHPADPVKKYVPDYVFAVTTGSEKVGEIRLRIDYLHPQLYHGGQIGYDIDERYRGRGYAGRACKLLLPVMQYHGMEEALITNDEHNLASRRVCEKLGARLIRLSRIPEWHDMYKEGERYVNVFSWRPFDTV